MFIQSKIKSKKEKRLSKKALSIIVGYVLLIVFATIVGVIVYKWQKTYVPQDEYAACPEGASLFITSKSYDCSTDTLTLDIKNNGQFAVGGYFIYLKDDPEKTIATIDISINNTDPQSRLYTFYNINGVKLGRETLIPALNNSFMPGDTETEEFYLPNLDDNIHGIEIVAIRWQKEGNRDVLASCKENKISEVFNGCSDTTCEPDNVAACAGRECGTVMNNCYQYVTCGSGTCPEGEFCDSDGQCVTSAAGGGGSEGGEIPDSCDGNWEGAAEDVGVVCDDGALCLSNCICPSGAVPDYTGGCMYIGGSQSCILYCLDQNRLLGTEYTSSGCTNNAGQCTGPGQGDALSGGNSQCIGAPTGSICCCYPGVAYQ